MLDAHLALSRGSGRTDAEEDEEGGGEEAEDEDGNDSVEFEAEEWGCGSELVGEGGVGCLSGLAGDRHCFRRAMSVESLS